MKSFDNATALVAAPRIVTDPVLKKLLNDRVRDWTATDLLDLTHLVIVEPGDTEAALVDVIGFSLLMNPIDGLRYGASGFVSPWDFYEEHDGWLELMITIGDSGFALFLLVAQTNDLTSELRAMCAGR